MEARDTNRPNKATRKLLLESWNKLDDNEKLILRSQRSQRGMKCDVCGNIGYFREICPNECSLKFSTPPPSDSDSEEERIKIKKLFTTKAKVRNILLDDDVDDDETTDKSNQNAAEPVSMLWTDFNSVNSDSDQGIARFASNGKSIDEISRKLLPLEKERLESVDNKLASYEYFAKAESGYNRDLPELTLHQILRRLMRALQDKLIVNARTLESSKDYTLLHPTPSEQKTFYPKNFEKRKEFKDYFFEKSIDKREQKLMHSHNFKGHIRNDEELHSYFRGDANQRAKGTQALLKFYDTKGDAGQSMHSKVGWKSILSHSDSLAVSDLRIAQQQDKVKQLMTEQGQWVKKQEVSMRQRNDRFEHCLHEINKEIHREFDREKSLLALADMDDNNRAFNKKSMDYWKERFESVDRIILLLHGYHFMGGLEELDYLEYCLEKWKETNAKPPNASGKNATSKPSNGSQKKKNLNTTVSLVGAANNPYYDSVQYINEVEAKHKRDMQKILRKQDPDSHSMQSSKGNTSPKPNSAFSADGALEGDRSRCASPISNAFDTFSNDDSFKNNSIKSKESNESAKLSTQFNDAMSQLTHESDLASAQTSPMSSPKFATRPLKSESLARFVISSDIDTLVENAKNDAETRLAAEREAKEQKMSKTRVEEKEKVFIVKKKRHQRDIDQENMKKEKQKFINANMKDHIRKGVSDDLLHLSPALIPVPKAFENVRQSDVDKKGKQDDYESEIFTDSLRSYAAQDIMYRIKQDMVLGDIGYTPQRMVPLYTRNTLVETHGCSAGGDQTQVVMALDSRYNHLMGRALNRFEPGKQLSDPKHFKISPYHREGVSTMLDSQVDMTASMNSSEYLHRTKASRDVLMTTGSLAMASQSQPQIQHNNSNILSHSQSSSSLHWEHSSIETRSSNSSLPKASLIQPKQSLPSPKAVKGTNQSNLPDVTSVQDKKKFGKTLEGAITNSLVRLAFQKPNRSLNDYYYQDELLY